ncbi:hypothetical protein BVRB_4g081160 [Beta vulgaris subsp. vulgaris]|nr:hypothetical protein BVRB_4g081160 [Beta vulgaris subsp. vulgaris]
MDSSHLDQADKSSPETLSESSLSPDSPDSNDIFGEPLVHPRVGDEYQVEIPSILNKSEHLQLMMNPADTEGLMDSSHSFLMGLPLPVMWVYNKANLTKDGMEPCTNSHAVCTNGVVESEKVAAMSQMALVKEESNVKADAPNRTYCLVPGQSSGSWSDFEADCFLLGLYIFGKNLLLVMRFMESKRLGQILAYYYGQFYGSSGYRRWSECRKMRNRKCVLGHRFFTGYRQHELFARLSPHLSEESKTKLLEASKAFAEGRTTLDEYVSSLKTLVGIHALVEAVGIGKGKEDLTTFILDSSKNSQMFTHRSEIPSGKACSSLTCAEIVKYLTGDFRLSKARSNDLFWEAVWPRLLARGWHSEQPRGDGYAGSKNCLVFLMPGIKKFSRRKLSKGEHYFDSVSDVLAKVAGEPELLELEADETGPSSSKVENGWAIELKSDNDQDSSDHERHCYLKPRVSSVISNLFKFTVVDTSLANEDNPTKVRELRSLPLEAKRCSFRTTDIKFSTDSMRSGLQSQTSFTHSKGLTSITGPSERMPGNSNLEPLKKSADANILTDHKSRTIKHQFSRRIKPGPSSCAGSVTKRRRVVSCVEAEVTCVLSLPARANKRGAASRAMMTNNAVPSSESKPGNVKVSSAESLVAGIANVRILQGKCLTHDGSICPQENEKLPREQNVIDLNLPQVPESDDNVKLEEGESSSPQQPDGEKPEHTDAATIGPSDTKEPLVCSVSVGSTKKSEDPSDQQPRRQSTRSRPLTTKALEALEIGFLNPVRQSRKRSSSTAQDQKPKRARQPRSKSNMFPSGMDFEVREAADENCNGKMDTLINAIPTEKATITRELLGRSETSFSPAATSQEMFT